jgi:hypothetical protein
MNENKNDFKYEMSATLAGVVKPLMYLAMAICFSVRGREFLSVNFTSRYNVEGPFILLLLCFVALQEARLWVRGVESFRENTLPLQVLVMGWWLFYLATLAAASHVPTYKLPEGLLGVCVWVTLIYFGTLLSHSLYEKIGGSRNLAEVINKGLRTEGPGQIEEARHQRAA